MRLLSLLGALLALALCLLGQAPLSLTVSAAAPPAADAASPSSPSPQSPRDTLIALRHSSLLARLSAHEVSVPQPQAPAPQRRATGTLSAQKEAQEQAKHGLYPEQFHFTVQAFGKVFEVQLNKNTGITKPGYANLRSVHSTANCEQLQLQPRPAYRYEWRSLPAAQHDSIHVAVS
jgi:hypothetical protein